MALMEDKENVAPATSSDPLQKKGSSPSPKQTGRRGRSKSIGPGGLEDGDTAKQEKQDAKNRRKSTYVPATKPILSSEQERKERQAARRRTLANRRVSFAPEATLHTWDVIEFMRDPTTSTDSADSTRRASNFTRSSAGGSPFKASPSAGSDPPSTPPEQEDEPDGLPTSPAPQRGLHQTKRRRSEGLSSSPVESSSPTGPGGSSDVGESEDEDGLGSDDETGTAMSIDVDGETVHSTGESTSSTGSSARLEAALRQAADQAGTRGIEYDEYGEDGDASMEFAGDTVTNAFKPWIEQQAPTEPLGSASLDQENVNPFSPAFNAQLVSGRASRPSTVMEEDTGDLSMDVTRAVGGIVNKQQVQETASSPLGDGTMDLTQAIGKIHSASAPPTGQKRRRSTADTGSPGVAAPAAQPKRRRSSIARSSMGDDTMDLTMAVGGIQQAQSPVKPTRRKSVVARRRSSGVASEQDEATMEFTQAIGGIKAAGRAENTSSSIDENEELTMELTTVLGGVKAAIAERPVTPQQAQSPIRNAVNTTPKDQERFKDAPDSGPKKLLTPIFEKQISHSAEKQTSKLQFDGSGIKTRRSVAFAAAAEATPEIQRSTNAGSKTTTPKSSPPKAIIPSSATRKSPLRATPQASPGPRQSSATPDSAVRAQLDQQLNASEPSPIVEKLQRSSPVRVPATPDKPQETTQDIRRLADSIKLLSTPRKETLKGVTPKEQPQQSPPKATTPRPRPTPKPAANSQTSPARQLSDDLQRIQQGEQAAEKVQLQKFLDLAGIRFMDLTTTKRRMTTAPTPSKNRKPGDAQDEPHVTLESAVVAGSCTVPELEMYEHACHELKRYISDGKRVIKDLETETAQDTPPLLRAYMAATPTRKMVLDSQMRDMKTQARLGSKELWYAWRNQLLEDLMRGLQGIGEGLIRDDEALGKAEEVLEKVVPGLRERYDELVAEAEQLTRENEATSEEEKAELEEARERLVSVEDELEEKKRILAELQGEMREHEGAVTDLEENRAEFAAAIQEAERIKEACRSVSTSEIQALKGESNSTTTPPNHTNPTQPTDSITTLERTHNWTIHTATATPTTTLTLTYKSHLKLFLHPLAFASTTTSPLPRPNAPISLHHTTTPASSLPTPLRFFLQLLQATLLGLQQSSTRLPDLLRFVASSWDTALELAEAARRLDLETLTDVRILADDELKVVAEVLVVERRAKVRVEFGVGASVVVGREDEEQEEEEEDGSEGGSLALRTSVTPTVKVVYGSVGDEAKMTEFVRKGLPSADDDGESSFDGWDAVVRELRERLVGGGGKGGKAVSKK